MSLRDDATNSIAALMRTGRVQYNSTVKLTITFPVFFLFSSLSFSRTVHPTQQDNAHSTLVSFAYLSSGREQRGPLYAKIPANGAPNLVVPSTFTTDTQNAPTACRQVHVESFSEMDG